MTEPDLVRWYREQLDVYIAQLAERDRQLTVMGRSYDDAIADARLLRKQLAEARGIIDLLTETDDD